MNQRIAIAGYPTRYGGAGSELHHQVICLLAMGVEVHIVPFGDNNKPLSYLGDRQPIIHAPGDWSAINGMPVVNFCSSEFLQALPLIRSHASATCFVNCMTWAFPAEVLAAKQGLIDLWLYQTDHAMSMCASHPTPHGVLADQPSYRPMRFNPYFHSDFFPFETENRGEGVFRVGRISRSDGDKWHVKQFDVWDMIASPKAGLVLGWNHGLLAKAGRPPPFVSVFAPGAIPQRGFYRYVDALVMTTDTFENLPRVGFEAMSSGTVLVVDDRGGWRIQVENGVTGYLCKDYVEMVDRANLLACDRLLMASMVQAARNRLVDRWGFANASQTWRDVLTALGQ